MKKIYIVTSGEYSDYGINCVFSSKKLAQKWIDGKVSCDNSSEDFNIEEWKLDSEVLAENVEVWNCGIMLQSGEIVEQPRSSKEYIQPFRGEIVQAEFRASCYCGEPAARVRSGISSEHCLKLAVEHRQKWLRLNKI
jgi:hypothetical protein